MSNWLFQDGVSDSRVEYPCMTALIPRLERLFESTGANAGHEFRGDPFRRRIADLRGLDMELDALASAANPGELLSFEAVSIHPHALPSRAAEWPAGLHVAWLLDENRITTGDAAPAELCAANPSDRHRRMLHAVYRAPDR
jgi:hypothetical protein